MGGSRTALARRVACRSSNKSGHVVIVQLRTVDRERLVRHLGRNSPATLTRVLAVLQEMFSP
ncbi:MULTISPECIES: type II toxin-antitoxin system PemK/MazF family toxin [Sorangium]|uniref:type II toxin-antitoxin system PemK/MazF family toxin n=1 Tax=Sorangium TaxID=39643 RepID=UPI003B8A6FB2